MKTKANKPKAPFSGKKGLSACAVWTGKYKTQFKKIRQQFSRVVTYYQVQ